MPKGDDTGYYLFKKITLRTKRCSIRPTWQGYDGNYLRLSKIFTRHAIHKAIFSYGTTGRFKDGYYKPN